MRATAAMTESSNQIDFAAIHKTFRAGRVVSVPASRRTDPESSHQAAERAESFRVKQYELVAYLLALYPGEHTSRELAALSGHDRYMIARRLTDARVAGLVVNGEQRQCSQAGTLAMTWRFAGATTSEGSSMHPVEFIRRNIQKLLFAEGFAPDDCLTLSERAVSHYMLTASFPKGGAFDECLKAARKAARALKLKSKGVDA